jgi:penicillin-binding protein 1A
MAPSRARPRVLRILLLLAFLTLAGGAGAAFVLWNNLVRDLPDLHTLADYRPDLTTRVLDRRGRTIGEFYEQRRQLIALEDVPERVVQAFVAAEDDTFFEHSGIDWPSILRAAWANLQAGGEIRQGASTITQQTVKALLLTPERSFRRKLREMVLARRIEERLTKQQILHLYLNQIYFGSGAYGIAEAAATYFGKSVGELEVGEAALLAGLPKAPGRNSPFLRPERAEERRRYVLERMLHEGAIDRTSYEHAVAHPPVLRALPEREQFPLAAYFTEEVRRRLVERHGGALVLRGGLVIETTLDLDLQRSATSAVRSGLEALDRRQGWRGPLRRVAAAAIEAERARLAEENGLLGPRGELLAPAPGARLVAVVTGPASGEGRLRVAFAPGAETTLAVGEARWAGPPKLGVGDVVRIRLPSPAAPAAPAAADAAAASAAGAAQAAPAAASSDASLDQRPGVQGALLSYDVGSGDVLALVGGYEFAASEFNRATQARRQPGSSFKPLIYAAALTRGWTPASIIYDSPVVYEDPWTGEVWRPENYSGRFLGPITLSESLARSINNSTIHLLQDVGIQRVVELGRRLGIQSPLEPYLTLALGASEVSLLELTRAYSAFPARGRVVEPVFVRRVLDRDGRVLLEDLSLADAPAPTEPALTPEQAFQMVDLMRGVITHPHGTGRKAASLGRPVAGKTGTTNEQADAWFMGFSPELVTGVWVGFDEKHVLGKGETGGRAALPIWIDYMKDALAPRPVRDFEAPEGIVFATIDPATGLLAVPGSPRALVRAFVPGTEPHAAAAPEAGASDARRELLLEF